MHQGRKTADSPRYVSFGSPNSPQLFKCSHGVGGLENLTQFVQLLDGADFRHELEAGVSEFGLEADGDSFEQTLLHADPLNASDVGHTILLLELLHILPNRLFQSLWQAHDPIDKAKE